MDKERKFGFEPAFDEESRLLVMGSFPSVKSREIDFYYGKDKGWTYWTWKARRMSFGSGDRKKQRRCSDCSLRGL